uniref:Uncharacterized protein n=1 Tax=Lygus hesperus TaxID=30085 RepID=A0A146M3I5_LYGHE
MLRDHAPTHLGALTPEQRSRFYLKQDGSKYFLPRNHIYYKQIQMQLGITGFKWCDFVIWTPKGLFVERIEQDETWWEDVSLKLMNVHEKFICPEYFEMKLPRELSLIELL